MAEKGVLISCYSVTFDGTNYEATATATSTDGNGGAYSPAFVVTATASSFAPAAGWASLLATAVKDYVDANYSLTVDQVLLPDLSVVSV